MFILCYNNHTKIKTEIINQIRFFAPLAVVARRKEGIRLMKKLSFILAFVLVVGAAFTPCGFAATQEQIDKAYKASQDFLYENVEPSPGFYNGEWTIYALARGNYPMSKAFIKKYTDKVEAELIEKNGMLHPKNYNPYATIILLYETMGLDPTDVAGYDLVKKSGDTYKDKNGNIKFCIEWRGLFGNVWWLRAMDSGNYSFPKAKSKEEQVTRAKLVNTLLEMQLKGDNEGAWSLSEVPDTDTTAMVIESLAPYMSVKKTGDKKLSKRVADAINKGLRWLEAKQNYAGDYNSFGGHGTSETTAQIICALTAVGINPNTDERFIRGGHSVVDGLLLYRNEKNGAFRHVNETVPGFKPTDNQLATEQACYALAAYKTRVPDKLKLGDISKSGDGFIISWSKPNVSSGYEIKIATDKKFKNAEKYKARERKKLIKGLKKGKTYFIKVRAYNHINGKTLYGEYSDTEQIVI